MKHIAYYISDHGYGHAARSIAIIRDLIQKIPDFKIHVCCDYGLDFIKSSLKKYCEIVSYHRVCNDVGYVTDERLCVDEDRTKIFIEDWLKTWDVYLKQQTRFCEDQHIDGIISDIAPQPFIIGETLGIPSIGVSNFTWAEIYEHIDLPSSFIEPIKNAYQSASLGLVLPLETHKLPFKKKKHIGLIYRSVTVDKAKIRSQLGIGPKKKIVYISLGYSPLLENQRRINIPDHVFDEYFIIVSSNNTLIKNPSFRIGADETESQNYIAAADIVISKFGYSTISEAVAYNVPMLLLKRNVIEDEQGVKQLLKEGVAEAITLDDLYDGTWIEKVSKMLAEKPFSKKIDSRYSINGMDDLIDSVKTIMV